MSGSPEPGIRARVAGKYGRKAFFCFRSIKPMSMQDPL